MYGVHDPESNHNIAMKALPCPCLFCADNINKNAQGCCVNHSIVGEVEFSTLKQIFPAECPAVLREPIHLYTREVLKIFLRNNNIHIPGGQPRKDILLDLVRKELPHI